MDKVIVIRNDKWKCPVELYMIESATDSFEVGGDQEEVKLTFVMELGRLATCDDSLLYKYLGDEKTVLAAVSVAKSDFTEEDEEGCVYTVYRPRFEVDGRKCTKVIVRGDEEVEEFDIHILCDSQDARLYPVTLCVKREIGKEERIEKSIDAFEVGLDIKHSDKDCLATFMFVFDDGFSRCDIAGIEVRQEN